MMKKWAAIFLAALLTFSAAACSGEPTAESTPQEPDQSSSQPAEPEAVSSEPEPSEAAPEASSDESSVPEEGGILVAYFSYGENADLPDGTDASATASIQSWNGVTTGNTGVVAAMIGEATGAELFSIQTVEKYPDTYETTIDQGQEERNANARPQLASHVEDLDRYDVVFLGFPNWWGDMPMAVYSFLDEVDLSGKTVIPFVTSGGSGFSGTVSTIESMEPNAQVQEGLSLSGSGAADAQEQVSQWLAGLGYAQ